MWRVLKQNNNYCVNERGEVLSLRKNKILFNSKLSKAVWQCDRSGNKIKMFPSTMKVECQLGIRHSNISYACKHNSTCHGYQWKYDENL